MWQTSINSNQIHSDTKTRQRMRLSSAFLLMELFLVSTMAVDCFPGATFPKMIGYGLADTNVVSIDRRASDEVLALAMYTTEA